MTKRDILSEKLKTTSAEHATVSPYLYRLAVILNAIKIKPKMYFLPI